MLVANRATVQSRAGAEAEGYALQPELHFANSCLRRSPAHRSVWVARGTAGLGTRLCAGEEAERLNANTFEMTDRKVKI